MKAKTYTLEITIPATRFSAGDIIMFRSHRLQITGVEGRQAGSFCVINDKLTVLFARPFYTLDNPADIHPEKIDFDCPLPTCGVDVIDKEACRA